MAGRKAVGRPEGEHRPRIMATKTSLTNKRILAVAGGEGGRRVGPGDRRMNKLKVCSTSWREQAKALNLSALRGSGAEGHRPFWAAGFWVAGAKHVATLQKCVAPEQLQGV